MAAPLKPIGDIQAHSTVEVEDSCNCCWGRKVKSKKSRRSHADESPRPELTSPVRDSHDVYNFEITIQESPKIEKDEKK